MLWLRQQQEMRRKRGRCLNKFSKQRLEFLPLQMQRQSAWLGIGLPLLQLVAS